VVETVELTATVRQDRRYIEALEAAAPDTPSNFSVRRVGDLYPPVSAEVEDVDFVLLNFPKGGGSWEQALAWAKSNGYENTNPREVLAVVEQHDLRAPLSRNWLHLIATTECCSEGSRRAVCVSVGGLERFAGLSRLEIFGSDSDWFLFRKKHSGLGS